MARVASVFLSAVAAVALAGSFGGPAGARVAADPEQELGRLLFWDPILSGHQDVACATCHHPDFAWADGRDLSLGTRSVGLGPERRDASRGEIPTMRRNSPTVLNTVFNGLDDRRGRRRRGDRGDLGVIAGAREEVDPTRAPMFWDRRVRSLEAQALEPLKAREEMRGDAYAEAVALDSVVARVRAIPGYVTLFAQAYGPDTPITAQRIGQAIAAFERSLVAVNSPFDRFIAGDTTALTAQQRRGFEVFDDADCTECHDGPVFSDFDLHAEGVAEHPTLAAPDTGDGRFRFRTPSLRNVALTPPYMHNGSLASLEEVLRFYDRGRSENPHVADRRRRGDGGNGARPRAVLDNDFRGVRDMSEQEMRDIIAFLESLTDSIFERTVPARVPSGLPPGGR